MLTTEARSLPRDARQQQENIRLIVAFLRDPPPSFTPEDAEATCSRGYVAGIAIPFNPRDKQPMGYEELLRWGILTRPSLAGPPEPDDAPSPRESPRFEAEVARHTDTARKRWERKYPRYLRLGVARALALLEQRDRANGTQDREIVRLVAEKWMTFRAAGALLKPKMAHSTIFDRYQAVMQEVEGLIWDDAGAGRMDG